MYATDVAAEIIGCTTKASLESTGDVMTTRGEIVAPAPIVIVTYVPIRQFASDVANVNEVFTGNGVVHT